MDIERIKINLEILSPSRKKPKIGDVFAIKPLSRDYYFGQVIKTDVDSGFGKVNNFLIYIFNATAKDFASVPKLSRTNLLIPPMVVNLKPWTLGYFQFVRNNPLTEILPEHSFLCTMRKVYFNEYGQKQTKPIDGIPAGRYGLASYGAVSEEMSEALGLS